MSTTAIQPREKELTSGLTILRDRAEALVVSDPQTYQEACQIGLDAKAYIKRVGFEFDPGIEAAKDTLDLLKNQKAKFVDPAKRIVEVTSTKGENWRTEEKRLAQQEQERLQAIARREAEEKAAIERKRAEAEAEAQRKEREKQIEAQRKAGELNKREAERLRKQAEAEEAKARELAAQQAAVNAAAVPEVEVKPNIPTVAGVKNQTYWKFRILDPNKIARAYLVPDEVAIGAMVRRVKDKAQAEAACPGIEVWSEG